MPPIGVVRTTLSADTVRQLCQFSPNDRRPVRFTTVQKTLARYGAEGIASKDGSWQVSGSFEAMSKINSFLESKESKKTADVRLSVGSKVSVVSTRSGKAGKTVCDEEVGLNDAGTDSHKKGIILNINL